MERLWRCWGWFDLGCDGRKLWGRMGIAHGVLGCWMDRGTEEAMGVVPIDVGGEGGNS